MFSRTTRMKRTLTLGALAASAALVLSACSGGLASGGETDSGDGPIKLGMHTILGLRSRIRRLHEVRCAARD